MQTVVKFSASKLPLSIMANTQVFGTWDSCSIQGGATRKYLGYKMTIGEQVKQRRKELGYTQKQLAEISGVAWQTISSLERGKPATISTLAKIVKHLGMTINITN